MTTTEKISSYIQHIVNNPDEGIVFDYGNTEAVMYLDRNGEKEGIVVDVKGYDTFGYEIQNREEYSSIAALIAARQMRYI